MIKILIRFSWIGPLIFTSAVIIFGFLNPGYSHVNQFISELGAKETINAKLMNYLGIVPFGLSILLFSIGAFIKFKNDILGKITFLILSINGILFVIAGLFSCDKGCDFKNMTQEAIIHNVCAFTAFLLFLVSSVLLGVNTFIKKKSSYYIFSLISGVVGIFLFYLISQAGIYSEYRGLYQRLFLTDFLIWLVLTGHFLRR